MGQKLLARAIVTADGKPLRRAEFEETRTGVVRVEHEHLDPESGLIQLSAISDDVRERIVAACELETGSVEDYWSIKMVQRTDVPPEEQFKRQLVRVPVQPASMSAPDGYTACMVALYPINRTPPLFGEIVLPEDLFSTLVSTIPQRLSSDLFNKMIDVVVGENPSIPDDFAENPLETQERFINLAIENKANVLASGNNPTTILPTDEVDI